jgi:hypothetical protein
MSYFSCKKENVAFELAKQQKKVTSPLVSDAKLNYNQNFDP